MKLKTHAVVFAAAWVSSVFGAKLHADEQLEAHEEKFRGLKKCEEYGEEALAEDEVDEPCGNGAIPDKANDCKSKWVRYRGQGIVCGLVSGNCGTVGLCEAPEIPKLPNAFADCKEAKRLIEEFAEEEGEAEKGPTLPKLPSKPNLWLVADDFDKGGNKWKNRGTSGQDVNNLVRRGNADKVTYSGYGAAAAISSVQGDAHTGLDFGRLPIHGDNYAMCTLTRYSGRHRGRILLGGGNWLWGHWGGRSGVAHLHGWRTSHHQNAHIARDDWLIFCGSGTKILANTDRGIQMIGNNHRVHQPAHQTMGVNWHVPHACCHGERSDFQIAEIIVWPQALSEPDLRKGAEYLLEVLQKGRNPTAAKNGMYAFKDGSHHWCDMITDGGGWTMLMRVNTDYDWIPYYKKTTMANGTKVSMDTANIWHESHWGGPSLEPGKGGDSGISTEPKLIEAYKGSGDWELRFSFYPTQDAKEPHYDGIVTLDKARGAKMFKPDPHGEYVSYRRNHEYTFRVLRGDKNRWHGGRLCWTCHRSGYEGGLHFGHDNGNCHLHNDHNQVMLKSHYARCGADCKCNAWYGGHHGFLKHGRLQVQSEKIAVWIRRKSA